jgi:PAS domain S-box-containing protein
MSNSPDTNQVYKFIFESSLDAILLTAPDGPILAANPAAETLFGYSQDELRQVGRGIVDREDPQLSILLEERRRKGKAKGELTFIRKNGEKFPGFISSHIFKDENGHERTSMTIVDLTEIKKAEVTLKVSEERYRYLFDTIDQGIVYQDSEGKIISANIAAQQILGLTLDEMQGRTSTDPRWKSIHEDGSDFPGEDHPAMVALKTGQKIENVVMGVYDPKREEQRWIKINAIPQFKNNEKLPYQVYTTFEDITKGKESLYALHESEKRYHNLFENMLDGYAYCKMLFDEQGRPDDWIYLDVNPAFEQLTGLKNVLGKLATEAIPGIKESEPELFEIYGRVALTGVPKKFEIWFKPLQIWLNIVVYQPEKEHFVAVFENITSRKKAEETLQKMASLVEIQMMP